MSNSINANERIEPAALKEKPAADYIGMSVSFLRQSRMNGDRVNRTPGPRWIQVGRAIRYLRADLDEWLERHRVNREVA